MLLLDAIYGIGLALASPYIAVRTAVDRKYRNRFRERFGSRAPEMSDAPFRIWIHGASAGEILAVSKLYGLLKEDWPGMRTIFTTLTYTGLAAAEKAYPDCAVTYLPIDLGPLIGKAVDRVRPDLLILSEGDLWPNFICAAKEAGAKIVVVNGTFSKESVSRYKKLDLFFGRAFDSIDLFCLRDEAQASNLGLLGIPSEKISVTGNIKYDNLKTEKDEGGKRAAALLALSDEDRVVIGGSTHDGEEAPLLDLFAARRDFRLVIVPRYPHRAGDIEELAGKRGLTSFLYSHAAAGDGRPSAGDVVVVDTVGDLASLYQVATAAFVGGSLVARGGQNMLDPAALGVPVLLGPYTFHFEEDVSLLKRAGGAIEVSDKQALQEALSRLLDSPETARETGRRAADAVLANQGALSVTSSRISRVLGKDKESRHVL